MSTENILPSIESPVPFPFVNGPNSDIIKSIDSSISMIKSSDSEGAKKSLLQAESSLEDKPNLSGAEKHIEASRKVLKEGDTNGALTHA